MVELSPQPSLGDASGLPAAEAVVVGAAEEVCTAHLVVWCALWMLCCRANGACTAWRCTAALVVLALKFLHTR
jgi:hypothetical protein